MMTDAELLTLTAAIIYAAQRGSAYDDAAAQAVRLHQAVVDRLKDRVPRPALDLSRPRRVYDGPPCSPDPAA